MAVCLSNTCRWRHETAKVDRAAVNPDRMAVVGHCGVLAGDVEVKSF